MIWTTIASAAAISVGVFTALVMFRRRRAGGPIAPDGGQLIHVADLVLERRSALHLMGIGTPRTVIATDPTGLKSVKVLNKSLRCAMTPTTQAGEDKPDAPANRSQSTIPVIREDRSRAG